MQNKVLVSAIYHYIDVFNSEYSFLGLPNQGLKVQRKFNRETDGATGKHRYEEHINSRVSNLFRSQRKVQKKGVSLRISIVEMRDHVLHGDGKFENLEELRSNAINCPKIACFVFNTGSV